MRATPYGRYLVQLTRFPRLFPINSYLVREDDGLTLIDTTIAGSADAIIKEAQQLGAPIVRIVLTHAHSDHVGSLDELRERLPDAEVLIGARDARLLAGDRSLDPDEPQSKLRGGHTTVSTTPTRTLQAGDRIGSLEVVSTPGHTPGHLAFVDKRDGTLIAGAAFQTRGGVAVAGTLRPFFPFPAMATWHKPTALESARALRDLHPTRLAVGHGTVLDAPLPAMNAAIAAAERSLGTAAVRAV